MPPKNNPFKPQQQQSTGGAPLTRSNVANSNNIANDVHLSNNKNNDNPNNGATTAFDRTSSMESVSSAADKYLSQYAAERLEYVPTTAVFNEFTPMCNNHKAVNLGQGFPSFSPPDFVTKAAIEAVSDPHPLSQQYARGWGDLALVAQLKNHFSKSLNGRELADDNVVVCNGGTQALNIVTMAFINPGEELIVIEPYFDVYTNDVIIAHGKPKLIPLIPKGSRSNDWTIDFEYLRKNITPGKTKAILLNTPQNVPGKVWSRQELEQIAEIAIEFDLLVFSDEVYDQFVYDGCEHVSIASLPGMWERTLIMGTAGKTFAVTGWKVGWIVGRSDFMVPCVQILSNQAFCVAKPLQVAAAKAFEIAESEGNTYYDELRKQYTHRRQLCIDMIEAAGLTAVVPQGSYFCLADISCIPNEVFAGEGSAPGVSGARKNVARDWKFNRWLVRNVGIGGIPCTAFCGKEHNHHYENFIRFAFCKPDEDLLEAKKRMKEKLFPIVEKAKQDAAAAQKQ